MKLLVGLGNPGPRYADSRHSAGFAVARRFAADHDVALDATRFAGRFGRGRLPAEGAAVDVAVLLPETFMNRSGAAVASALAGLPTVDPAGDLLVVYDDVDLPFGTLRMRLAGGAGGQRGVADVIERLGHRRFPRLRFGIGRPPPGVDTVDHVLAPFSPAEAAALPDLLARASRAVARAFALGVPRAMNEVNRDPSLEPGSD